MDAPRKRLKFRAWRRGFREMDLILGGFADAHAADLDEDRLAEFERLLDAPDQDVYEWIVGRAAAPAEFDTVLLAMIRRFRYSAASAENPDES